MNPLDLLQSCLLEILHELDGTGVTLTIGGGYGLILKRQRVIAEGSATLLTQPPQMRSTNDLDLFLQVELLANSDKARFLANVLKHLEFVPVETAKYYQFVRRFDMDSVLRRVKIDLLSGPPRDTRGLRLEDDRRVKSRDKTIALHARRTDEAVAVEEEVTCVSIQGHRLNSMEAQGIICLPNAFSYLLMKLYAFHDKEERGDPDNSSKHATDLYQILALTTEPEWETAKRLKALHTQNPIVQRAGEMVQERFAEPGQLGIIRLREYSPFFRQINATDFSSILTEMFPKA